MDRHQKGSRKGCLGKLQNRDYFDKLYGVGRWLPLPRFPIFPRTKWRAIDDAKRSGTDSAAAHQRRAHAASLDFIVQLSHWLRNTWKTSFANSCDDCQVEGGVDDETAAFRLVATRDDDAPFLTVSVFISELKHIQFGPMWVHPFGVGSAVANYNRRPELVVHFMRTFSAVLMVHVLR